MRYSRTNIGKKIKKKRTELGWSQAYLAKVAGCSRVHISRLENGISNNPEFETLKNISYSLGIELAELCQ
jgi:transcriptional regulator with XRE-family HTH domain